MTVLFHMWGNFREHLISNHQFYVDQANSRLLSQFEDLESEAERVAEEWLAKRSRHFDPDLHDPGDDYERAYSEGTTHYQLLEDMRDQTRLAVIAGFFHDWEKQLRDWTVREIMHWHKGSEVSNAVWSQDFGGLSDLFSCLGWKIRSKPYFDQIDACRLVVNVYKHGEGISFRQLKKRYPRFIMNPLEGLLETVENDFIDHKNLNVTCADIQDFSKAIVEFWNDVPDYIRSEDQDSDFPKWFEKAWEKDEALLNCIKS